MTNKKPEPVSAIQGPDFYKPEQFPSNDSVGFLMKRVMLALVTDVDRQLEAPGLTHAQWAPLFLLRQGRVNTLAELSRELQLDAGALTRTLDRLEAKGLCTRERSTQDRRVVHLALTDEGLAASAHVPKVLCETLNAFLGGFSHDEWQTLLDFLRRMAHNAELVREASGGVNDIHHPQN
ncbi:MarR family transcriptional regulator [Aquabacterium sp.]|uniref:MarR family winged helix-turn-helix transcriptional regulator n=1 Tax=Aquabacterium sp. TaxID=1872578 RepID=UPI00199AF3EF|nr:MarR family transcriptional regulator [Aquabacterium sp.]MBC7698902.1 MarR family transcriptional regulator [Aquabacterium sp.]